MKQEEQLQLLQQELDAFSEQVPQLTDDNLFVAWFLRAYLTESDDTAIAAVTGGARDKALDAVLIDDKARVAYLVQAKYRRKRFGKAEPRSSVIEFSSLAQTVCDPEGGPFSEFLEGMDSATSELLKEARRRVTRNDYRLVLIFVTLGACSKATERDARQTVRRALRESSIEIIDGRRTLLLLQDYLDGAAPPIPTLDVPMEAGGGIKVNGVLQRYDTTNRLESWVFSVRGDAIARMFEIGGRRLFARNIRGFLGESTPVNEAMLRTLAGEPGRFFYYNNGITVVCDRAEKVSHKGSDVLRVSNPQVINGQQTTRVLADSPNGRNASVLVKVIQIPRDPLGRNGDFEGLIGRIVQATNWQNAIKPSDLMSNDRRQLEIEKALRHLDYFYARKRQTKSEVRSQMRGHKHLVITKEELAQAVAGAELDPVVARSGKDNLFTESLYDQVFPNANPDFYLPRYWLFKEVTRGARGAPQRGYTKWMVLGFVWSRLVQFLRSERTRRDFVKLCRQRDRKLLRHLGRAVNVTYKQALSYYRANKGRGEAELDISLFFRSKKGRDNEFEEFWRRSPALHKRAFQRASEAVAARVEGGL